MKDDKIIERIQKLLSLANSDNEHEAKMATQRANELLFKYNLNLQQIKDFEPEYIDKTVANSGLTLKPHQLEISQILMKFFFVKVIIQRQYVGESSGQWAWKKRPRAQYVKTLKLIGTKENCEVASYIFEYLNQIYPKLWKDYYERDAKINHSDRKSYYLGLTIGISKMLEETKWKIQEETGLVLVKDPKLEAHLEKITKGNYSGTSNTEINRDVLNDGMEDGSKVTLRKPIKSERTSNGLSLDIRRRKQ